MIFQRYLTDRENAVKESQDMLRAIKGLVNEKGMAVEYFHELGVTLKILNEEGFVFDSTELAYEDFRKVMDHHMHDPNLLEYKHPVDDLTDSEIARNALNAALDDIEAQKEHGLVRAFR